MSVRCSFFSHKGIIRDGETSVTAAEGGQRIKTAAVWKSRLSNESKTLEAMIPVNKQRPRNLRRDVIAAASRLRMELLSGKRIPHVYSASTFYLLPSPALRCLARVRFVSRWKHFHLQWAKKREKNGAPNISVDNRADYFSNQKKNCHQWTVSGCASTFVYPRNDICLIFIQL